MSVTMMLAVALAVLAPDAEGERWLEAERLYNGANRPLFVHVRAPGDDAKVTLELLAADGQRLAEPIDVAPGRLDLEVTMPGVWNLRRAAYLQALVDGEPVGSPLVLQPMLTRRVPVLEVATRADGTPYWHIARFIPEAEDAERLASQLPVIQFVDPEAPPDTDEVDDEDEDEDDAAAARARRPVFTGLRVYPDRDVVMHTDHGDIHLAMEPAAAPNTAWNFMHLAGGGFYDGVVFHRVVPYDRQGRPFVIQAGDPGNTGSGGPGYWLPMEPGDLRHDFGVISMARDMQPDSAGSQIFICLSREGTARLDGQYCAFGYAVDGAETIKSIAGIELADIALGRPVHPPVIRSAELIPAPPRRPGLGRPDVRVSPEAPAPVRTRPPRVPR